MPEYEVVWKFNIDADNPRDAAVLSQNMLRDDTETDWIYEVTDCNTKEIFTIDLDVAEID